jgi:hypothetical protein
MSQFNFQPQANPFDQIKVIIHRVKVAVGSVNQQGQFVQTHIGEGNVLPLAKAAYSWGLQLPEGLVITDRPHQYAIGPVVALVNLVESYLWHTHQIPPVQITDPGPTAPSRTAYFGELAPEVQQAVDAQRQRFAPEMPAAPAQTQSQFVPPVQHGTAPQLPFPSQGQIPVPPYQPPNPAAPQQQVPVGSPVQNIAPPIAPPPSPYAQMGLPDPNAPAPAPQTPLEQMGLTPPNPFTPPLAQATPEEMAVPDPVMPDNTPAGKGEAQSLTGFDPSEFAQNQASGLNPYANPVSRDYTSDRGVYAEMPTTDLDAALLAKQMPVDPVLGRDDKIAQLVGYDMKAANEIIAG